MSAHEMVCGGVRRRIGKGESTFIWEHPWLLDVSNPMVQTVMRNNLQGSMVSRLIDMSMHTWDLPLLRDIFTPEDVERIIKVPISPSYDDSWYWVGDPNG